jgi:hypothetical protein
MKTMGTKMPASPYLKRERERKIEMKKDTPQMLSNLISKEKIDQKEESLIPTFPISSLLYPITLIPYTYHYIFPPYHTHAPLDQCDL